MQINDTGPQLEWTAAEPHQFEGNLRIIHPKSETQQGTTVYQLRKLSGEIFILALPEDPAELAAESSSAHAGLDTRLKSKLKFEVLLSKGSIGNDSDTFARFTSQPEPLLLALYCANMPDFTIPVKVVIQDAMMIRAPD